MDGEEWSVEDGLLAEELMLAAERQASSRGTSTSAPARVDASKSANGRSVVTRSRARAAQCTETTPAAQPEDLPAAAAEDASPRRVCRRSAAALESTDDADLSLISPSRKLVEVDVTKIVVDAREQYNVIPEVEDIGAVMDRRQLRPSGFSVTGAVKQQQGPLLAPESTSCACEADPCPWCTHHIMCYNGLLSAACN